MTSHHTAASTGSRRHRLRVTPWRGRTDVAVVGPHPGSVATAVQVADTLGQLAADGVTEVFSVALPPAEQQPFVDAGFIHHEHLVLMRHDLGPLPQPGTYPFPQSPHRLRRARRRDLDDVVVVDNAAFDEFWGVDHRGLADARSATPTHRFRVATIGTSGDNPPQLHRTREVAGYAITGRARRGCYLQRLAVHPAHQETGLGGALVADAVNWARSRRAHWLLVNTQEHNCAAQRLYLRLGFKRQAHGLDVYRWTA